MNWLSISPTLSKISSRVKNKGEAVELSEHKKDSLAESQVRKFHQLTPHIHEGLTGFTFITMDLFIYNQYSSTSQ